MKKVSLLLLLLVIGVMVFLLQRVGSRTHDVVAARAKAPVISTVPQGTVPSPRLGSGRTPAAPLAPLAPPPADTPPETPPDAIPGEQVMVFYDDAHMQAFLEMAGEEGLDVVGRMDRLRAVRVRVGDEAVLRRVLARVPAPIERGPNLYVRRPEPPEPPEGVVYYAFDDTGPGWIGAAADRDTWGHGVKVAVLDTAVAVDPSRGNAESVNLLDDPVGTAPVGHGTAVASIITGSAYVAGVAPGVDLLAVRVMSDAGVGDAFTLARGVMDAVDRGARVLNISVGSVGDAFVLREAIAYALQQGAVVVAAAGNDGQEGVLYPARYPGVVSVGAVDADGRQMYFSNRGDTLDLVAPGVGVAASGGSGRTVLFSGTSAAAPFVAGAMAGVWSESPELSAREVVALLTDYADDAGAPGRDDRYGAGMVNVGRVRERDTPGLVDMALVQPYVERHPIYGDELNLTLFGQNRGTERLARVVLTADVDGAPVDVTFYDVGVGEIIRHDMRLTGAGIGERTIEIQQALSVAGEEDRSPRNNRMISILRTAE